MPKNTPETTHDLAEALQRLADQLKNKPAIELPQTRLSVSAFCQGKDKFIALAKTFGGDKYTDDWHFGLKRQIGPLTVDVYTDRNTVCKIVQPAKPAVYECSELLTPEEQAEVSGGQ